MYREEQQYIINHRMNNLTREKGKEGGGCHGSEKPEYERR